MSFGSFHIDFIGLGQALLGLTALITAWRSRNIAKEKDDAKKSIEAGK